jgi:hypothetical protein
MRSLIIVAKTQDQFEKIKRWLFTESQASTTDDIKFIYAYNNSSHLLRGHSKVDIWLGQNWTDLLDTQSQYEWETALKLRKVHGCTIEQAKY